MNNLFTHYPVNWIDGMKLSSRTHSYYTRHELQARASGGCEPHGRLWKLWEQWELWGVSHTGDYGSYGSYGSNGSNGMDG